MNESCTAAWTMTDLRGEMGPTTRCTMRAGHHGPHIAVPDGEPVAAVVTWART